LHEIDLLVDREIVEPWRRSGDYLGHEKNSYDQEYIVNRRSRKEDKFGEDRFRSQPPLFSPRPIPYRADPCRNSPWPLAATCTASTNQNVSGNLP
jgi:hypothetical protein